ncbi:LuxR family transcriptional regulator [Streptomyces sodiiphilus]|uniref:LuxR family transcriptional regulator n=1 Tax=Streptomyces sodiiphilus TaxID=226217 RepID=UPI0031D28274
MYDALLPRTGADGEPESRRAGTRGTGDDLEDALLNIRGLTEDAMLKHRTTVTSRTLVTDIAPGESALHSSALQVMLQATSTIDVVLGPDPVLARAVHCALRDRTASRPQGLRVRLLCHQSLLDGPGIRSWLAGRYGEVRVSRTGALAATIVDEQLALVSAESASVGRTTVIRAPAVVRTMQTLFCGVWRNAVLVPDRIDFGGRAKAATVRCILEKLQVGMTDEAAARDLSVSVRTYRRYVAEIMTMLGATSRFQAGVRAAELGWLPEQSAPSQVPVGAVAE